MINRRLHRYVEQLDPTQHYLVTEFVDNYEDGVMRRRDMLERVVRITGSTAAAAGVLLAMGVPPLRADPLASADFAPPAQGVPSSPHSVAPDDPAIVAGPVTFPSGTATIMGYWARPAAAGRYPAVLICHENQGTDEHFRDVARRFAKAGYVGLHLDLLSRQGGTDAVPQNQRGAALSGPGAVEQFVEDFRNGMTFLRRQPFVVADRIGMTGYCYGGGMTWNVAVKERTLRAIAPYYGTTAYPDEVSNIRAAALGVYAANDARVNAQIDTIRAGLEAAGVPFRLNVYPDAGHAFFNDTRPSYVESASLAAWSDTLEWFATYLRAGLLPATGDGDAAGSSHDTCSDDAGSAEAESTSDGSADGEAGE